MFNNVFAIFVFAAFVTMTLAHSQMRCAKYDIATGTCSAPIRNEAYSKMIEAYEISSGLPICQFPMSNPISASYANGAGCPDWAPCPSPMGTYKQGENFTVMWFARNHAVLDQTPGTIVLYLSPVESSTQGVDYPKSSYTAFCTAPYMSCNGANGNEVQCYASCQMPTTAAVGIHTLWWKWDWQSAIYSTCADIVVTAGSSTPVTPTPVAPTPAVPTPTPVTPSVPSTTAATVVVPTPTPVVPVTPTVPSTPSTTAAAAVIPTPTPATPTPVAPTPVAPTPVDQTSTTAALNTDQPCVLGNQVCLSPGSNQYRTCTNGRNANYWAPAQTCRAGQTCHPSATGNNIYCY